MRVALVHDYLNQYGGAERVLEVLMEIFPEAPVYTLFYDKQKTRGRFEKKIKGASFLNNSFVCNHHRAFIPLMPLAADLMNLKGDYDLIISSSAGFGKGIAASYGSWHIAYIHTPLRYAWETYQYFNWPWIIKKITAPIFQYLRNWDYRAGQKPDILLANSNFIAKKIEKYYGRKSEVLYPPVDLKVFYPDPDIQRGGYFLAAGRMLAYKHFDLIIEAFNRLELPLRIVGGGPEFERLKKMAKFPNIDFLPFINENDLRRLYSGADAFIFPQVEDFGLVAAEAQACGTPVIAFSEGGAREIVEDKVTGIFFHQQSVDALVMGVKRFLKTNFDHEKIRLSAERFSKEKFKNRMLELAKSAQLS